MVSIWYNLNNRLKSGTTQTLELFCELFSGSLAWGLKNALPEVSVQSSLPVKWIIIRAFANWSQSCSWATGQVHLLSFKRILFGKCSFAFSSQDKRHCRNAWTWTYGKSEYPLQIRTRVTENWKIKDLQKNSGQTPLQSLPFRSRETFFCRWI